MKLSRGARRLLESIRRQAQKYPDVFVLRSTFARWLKCSVESISRWVAELKRVGLLLVRQSGPQSAIYDLQQTALAQLDAADYDKALAYQRQSFDKAPPLSIKHATRYRNTAPAPRRKPPEPEQNYILPHMRAAYEECLAGRITMDQAEEMGRIALAAAG